MENDNKFATPGQFMAVVEECVPGFGAAEEDGKVYTAIAGEPSLEAGTASVKNRKAIRPLSRGDIVYGVVRDTYDSIALIEFQSTTPKAAHGTYGYIRIANVQRGYTENFREVFRIGDFVKAKINEVKPLGIYLTMADSGLGVVRAFCISCRNELDLSNSHGELRCSACGRRQGRKLALEGNGERHENTGRRQRQPQGSFGRPGYRRGPRPR